MDKIANIVDTLRYRGSVDSSDFNDLPAVQASAAPAVENWQMNFEGGTLSGSCQINSDLPILGAGLIAYSEDGVKMYFGTYCSMSDAKNQTTDTVAFPTASTALFNPDADGRTIMSIVYGELIGADGKATPFSQQQKFTV
ncbi:MAG: hypothetical protein QOF62_254 [Pyrinomonadaceae bacterium]|jgi:hypothetical protein|nr:hypothetical protein [Pyrinomonadaceae bacterium]